MLRISGRPSGSTQSALLEDLPCQGRPRNVCGILNRSESTCNEPLSIILVSMLIGMVGVCRIRNSGMMPVVLRVYGLRVYGKPRDRDESE
jgi:hypothetical protein